MTVKPKPIIIAPEIVEAAKKGDQFAISEIYEKCYNTIYYVVKSIIVDEDTTQDIVQDSFMKAFKSLSKLDASSSFVPWMKRLATNTAKDWLKKKKPILFSSMYPDDDDSDEQEPEIEDIDLTQQPEEALDAKTKKQLLWEIINDLPEEQRLVVSMFYFQEMSVADIAESLGVSQGTVKSRLNYARKKIECKVLDLEKKGTKLYGLAPIPFLIWLFMQNQQANAVSAPAISVVAASGAKTAVGVSSKAAVSSTSKAGAAGKGLAIKVTAGIAGVAAVGGIAFGIAQIKTPDLYSWYIEPSVSAADINVLIQEVPDAYRDNAADSTNWQHMYDGNACYYTNQNGVGIINYDGEIIVPATYTSVSVQESGTIVLTDDSGSYKVLEDGQLTAYEKSDVQTAYEEYLIKNFGHVTENADVGLNIISAYTHQDINGNTYYDAGIASDGLYAVENDSNLWGYINESTGDTVIQISLAPAWNIDPSIVDVSFINYFRISPNGTFDVNMENLDENTGKGAFQLSRAYDASNGYIVINIPGQGYSLITTSGETIIPAGEFYQLRPVYNGKLWAQQEEGGDWGIIQLNEDAISEEVFTNEQ